MYISDQMQKAIQEDIVNTTLRQAELRWMVKESETQPGVRTRAWTPGITLAKLVRLATSVPSRP